MNNFHDRVIKGSYIKDLVKTLLEKSGYSVFPHGYESTFSQINKWLSKPGAKNSPTIKRLRSSPDLIVYDEETKDATLVESKMIDAPDESQVMIDKLDWYRKYWNDSILVVAVPCGHFLYAQKVDHLPFKTFFDANKEFLKFEDMFPRVTRRDAEHFGSLACQFIINSRTFSIIRAVSL